MQACEKNRIGIYTRISRDDNGENYESIENQRNILLDYAEKLQLGGVYSVYVDDNVSGSAFERKGFEGMKQAVLDAKIDLILLKDLSRLGRNNAKTLQWIDFFEEHGVRILTADGRYDSLLDNETVGIETWANERYIRDISRKIRSSLRIKIKKGEYLGNAPFGYKKSDCEKNRLVVEETEKEIIRLIYRLYRTGRGYTSIAKHLNEKKCISPEGTGWNRITVRRILSSRVYIGDTVQGISEKVSFKSKKTRRLPEQEWTITEGTHTAIIAKEEFLEVQRLRESKVVGRQMHKAAGHLLNGVLWCGNCGSIMYARKRAGGIGYVCGNYFRNGRSSCSSHFIYEEPIVECICNELKELFIGRESDAEIAKLLKESGHNEFYRESICLRLQKELEISRRHQDVLYKDRLEGRISEQLFDRMNRKQEERLKILESEIEKLGTPIAEELDASFLVGEAIHRLEKGELTNELSRLVVSRIIIYDGLEVNQYGKFISRDNDNSGKLAEMNADGFSSLNNAAGAIVIDFRF